MDAMATRVIQLELQVQALEEQQESTQSVQERREQKAQELLREIRAAREAGDMDQAQVLLETMLSEYLGTSAWHSAQRLLAEVQVPGKLVPASAGESVESWFTPGSMELSTGTTVLFFWEVWCPHCVRELPRAQEQLERLSPEGLKIVALTRLSKSSTEEKVQDFISENELTLPIAKEDGQLADWAQVSGIPAAVVIRDGVAVWRGHPASLDDEALRKLMRGD
jgi:thiol-disulfide isomerase/thioredoxin